MMEYINLFSEFYLSVFFFIILTVVIFINLSKEKNYPNYYNATCYIIVLILSNQIVIDIWNRFDIYFSYDLSKNMGDIYFKFFLIFLSIIYLIYSNFYVNKMHFNDFEYLILLFFIIIKSNIFTIYYIKK